LKTVLRIEWCGYPLSPGELKIKSCNDFAFLPPPYMVAVTGITKTTQVEQIVLLIEKTGFPVVTALYDMTRHTG